MTIEHIVFDHDGPVVTQKSVWSFLAEKLHQPDLYRLKQERKITDEEMIYASDALWRANGANERFFLQTARTLGLEPHITDVVNYLWERKKKLSIVSLAPKNIVEITAKRIHPRAFLDFGVYKAARRKRYKRETALRVAATTPLFNSEGEYVGSFSYPVSSKPYSEYFWRRVLDKDLAISYIERRLGISRYETMVVSDYENQSVTQGRYVVAYKARDGFFQDGARLVTDELRDILKVPELRK